MNQADTGARERILGRVRQALLRPAENFDAVVANRPMFAPVTDCLERFVAECAANRTECVLTANADESAAAMAKLLRELPAGEVFVQDDAAMRELAKAWTNFPLRWSSDGPAQETLQATITLAEGLVAATGSIFVSTGCGGRGGSIVAPAHIVYATADQLVPDLEGGLIRLRTNGVTEKNSFVGLITGSSRTADIEKLLVIGAHGPRRLAVVLQASA